MQAKLRPPHQYSFPAYVIAGALSTGTHYAVTIALVELGELRPLFATMVGFGSGAFVKYVLNYSMAFRSQARHPLAAGRYVMSLAGLFAANAAMFWILNGAIAIQYMLAQLITTVALLVPGYCVSRYWVFD